MTRILLAFVGTFAVLATHGLIIAALAGIGLWVRRAFALPRARIDEALVAFWLGFAVVLAFLILWHFVIPVNAVACAIVMVVGLTGVWIEWRRPSAFPQEGIPRWAYVVFGLLALYVANRATGPMRYWDTAMYHAPGVKWATAFAVVPGLGNLYGPLGLNNASLLYDAMLEVGPWRGGSWHVANGPLVTVLIAQALLSLVRFRESTGALRAVHVAQMLLLALAVEQTAAERTPSFVTDLPVSLLLSQVMVGAFALLLRGTSGLTTLMTSDEQSRREFSQRDEYEFFVVMALAAASLATKINAAIFSAAAVVVVTVLWSRRRLRDGHTVWGPLARTFGLTGAFVLAWLVRGVVLTGYPLFHSTVLAMPVEWLVPAEHAQAEFALAAESARATTQNYDFVAGRISGMAVWFPRWFSWRVPILELALPALLAILATISAVIAWRGASPARREEVAATVWLLIPPTLALITWFVLAPEPRYASPYFWTFVAITSALGYLLWSNRLPARARGITTIAALVIGIEPIILEASTTRPPNGSPHGALYHAVRAVVVIPDDGEIMPWSTWEKRTTYTTGSGLVLEVAPTRCGFGPIPCTLTPASNVRLRTPNDLSSGFVVDGEWQMQRWPWRDNPEFLRAWREKKQREASAAGR